MRIRLRQSWLYLHKAAVFIPSKYILMTLLTYLLCKKKMSENIHSLRSEFRVNLELKFVFSLILEWPQWSLKNHWGHSKMSEKKISLQIHSKFTLL